MANTTTTPNMNIPVPVPGVTPGSTEWADDIVADMTVIDNHNHTNGKGVPIPPDGINVNNDLPMNDNNLTTTRSVRFFAQGSPLALASDIGCIYESGVDLWYNDGSGNQVRITQGGSVTGSSGTITGLPSGTASASFSAGTFTFQSATNTPASMAVGPLIVGSASVSPNTVTISPSTSLPSSYSLTLPLALPGSGTQLLSVDSSGSMGSIQTTGTGSVVLGTGPTFTGTPLGTITSSTYSPTVTATVGTAATAAGFSYIRVGDRVLVDGQISGTTASSGGFFATVSLPLAPTSNFSLTSNVVGIVGSQFGGLTESVVFANTGAKTATARGTDTSGLGVTSITINIHFAYSCA